ncbi:polysaccharide biosynthesis/export family protein [Zavarzinia sp. CC-PAN008]|uniref:polysaccharide biosynthesis/export family protein n=1 Tax=Zavarzinia sp. CC-PAN008 TaxID=3243332 RepID=UPI003F7459C4
MTQNPRQPALPPFSAMRLGQWLVCLVGLLLLAACGNVVRNPTPVATATSEARARLTEPYRIQAGDVIDVTFFYTPEYNLSDVLVRPDGGVFLPAIGEVALAGLTATEASQEVDRRYLTILRQPGSAVMIKSIAGSVAYVTGEVRAAGAHKLDGPTTVLGLIASSGGAADTARMDEVVVIRTTGPTRRAVIPVNLAQAIAGIDTDQDLRVMPGDIVIVPRSQIADINLAIDQYVKRVLPLDSNMSFQYDFTPSNF